MKKHGSAASLGMPKTLAFVLNHPFFKVDGVYYSPTPNIHDLMLALLTHVDRVVLCGPTTNISTVDRTWELVPNGLEVFELPFYPDNLALILRAPILLPRLLFRIIPALRSWAIVGAVAPSGFGLVTVLAALLARRTCFLYVRGNSLVSLADIYNRTPWKRRLMVVSFWPLEVTTRICTRLGVPTCAMGSDLAVQFRGPRVCTLPGYARPAVVTPPLPGPVDQPEKLCHFIFVGRLSFEKGLDILLHALAGMKSQGHLCHLTVAGSGPDAQLLHDLAEGLDVQDNLNFVGYVVDPVRLRELYLSAGVAVVPSRTEGIPVAMIEAMALGRAVVATRVGGIPSVIEHERNGLLVRPDDPEALGEQLGRLLDDPGLAYRLATAAAATGEALSVSAQAQRMAECYGGANILTPPNHASS